MSLIKNDFPIFEYDTDNTGIIMPGHDTDFRFNEKVVMLFMEKEIDDYVLNNECEIIGEFTTITKKFYVYKTIHKGEEITFCQAPLGGAASVQIMEQLIAGGAKKIIAVGCCGALFADNEGDFYIPTSALRQEGTSYHYLPPSRVVELSESVISAIEKTLSSKNISFKKCKTWTTDGFYRETKAMVEYRKEEGCSVVEMECASLASCAKMRGVEFGQILFTADSLADVNKHDTRNWGNNTFAFAMDLAFDTIIEV